MKYTEINALYTAKVAEMIANGYSINSPSMNGSQGEIAHIDFRKGDDVIRVFLTRNTNGMLFAEQVVLTVGRCTDEYVIATKDYRNHSTIWNNRLEIIEQRVFWKMENRRDTDWYIEGEDGKKAVEKRNDRQEGQFRRNSHREFSGVERVMLPAIKRHLGKDRFPVANIRRVYKYWERSQNRFRYCADTTKGTVFFS